MKTKDMIEKLERCKTYGYGHIDLYDIAIQDVIDTLSTSRLVPADAVVLTKDEAKKVLCHWEHGDEVYIGALHSIKTQLAQLERKKDE